MRHRVVAALVFVCAVIALIVGCGGGGGAGSATARCVDGTYSHSQNCSGTCSSHGGVAEFFNDCGSGDSGDGGSDGSDLGCTQGTTGFKDNSNYAGRWSGGWTQTPATGEATYDNLQLNVKLGKDGKITGTARESITGVTYNVTGRAQDILQGGSGLIKLCYSRSDGSQRQIYTSYLTASPLNSSSASLYVNSAQSASGILALKKS